MATLYSGGKIFDGEKAIDGHAVLEEDGRIKRLAPAGEFVSFAGPRVDTSGGTLLPGDTEEPGIGTPGSFVEKTLLLREVPTNLLLYFANQSTPNSSLLLSVN